MRRTSMASVFVLSLLVGGFAAPAAAQTGAEVSVGGSVDVSNGTECPPNTEAIMFLDVEGQDQIRLGATISDEAGHIETKVSIPEDQPVGPASIIVNCGIVNSVLVYNVTLVEPTGFSMPGLLPILVGILALGALATLFILRRSGNDDEDAVANDDRGTDEHADSDAAVANDDTQTEAAVVEADVTFDDVPMEVPAMTSSYSDDADDALADIDNPAAAIVDDPLADIVGGPAPAATIDDAEAASAADGDDAEHDDDDDGAEYWFWDVETSRGPARRLACLTDDSFHLDEIPLPAFPALLERITAEGPQTALARGFLSVPLDRIQGVYRRGTEVKIAYAGPDGQQAKTIDLGSEVDGVLDLLSQRFAINTVAAPAEC